MTLPSVSVVIPTYDRAAWLPETVESVLQQTHPPAEVIIVDDGSQDDTEAVCESFPAPVRYIRQENAGVSAARNRGIREAKNEWVALVDSDDIWRPHKLEVQLTALVATPHARWCASGCEVIGTDGKSVAGRQGFERVFAAIGQAGEPAERFFGRWLQRSEVRLEEETHTTFTGDLFEMLFQGNAVLPSSVLIQRSLFEEVGLFDDDFQVAEETEFFHRVAAHADGSIVMSPLVGYRVAQSGSLTNPANTPRLIRNALTSLERAAALRPQLTPAEQAAYQRGRRRLLSTLAYAELSLLNGEAARQAQQAAWSTGAGRTPRSLVIYAATLLPVPLLRGLHGVKRGFSAVRG
ncbi:MAG: glycosyltransferase family 2 protein [Gemmatimonadetes bacterium]|nr:glycosyltransferase family 2 protein [Gemmatimonadota bacterium]